jgi:hypothetical protein
MDREHGWIGRKDRHPVTLDAIVHHEDGKRVPVQLIDVSDEGCRIESNEHFRIGERVQIDIPRLGLMKAQIRWALPESAGAKFLADDDPNWTGADDAPGASG